MTFELHLIRHGQSVNNALPESQRVEDPGLTELGNQQAKALATRFDDVPVTHLLTSGFLRAVQTTQPLADCLNLRPTVWIGLHEVGGCYAGYEMGKELGRPGMNRDTLSSQFPDFQLPEDLDSQGWWRSQRYENWMQARQRSQEQVGRLVHEFGDSSAMVVCVIHADFKALMIETMAPNRYHEWADHDLHNTGVTSLRYDDGQFEVIVFNDIEHLQTERDH